MRGLIANVFFFLAGYLTSTYTPEQAYYSPTHDLVVVKHPANFSGVRVYDLRRGAKYELDATIRVLNGEITLDTSILLIQLKDYNKRE